MKNKNPITINNEMIRYFSQYIESPSSERNLKRTDILEGMYKIWQAMLDLNIRYEAILLFQISLASTNSLTPSIIFSIVALDKEPIFSTRSDLFTVIICDIFTAHVFLRLPSPF